jgi:hypothetical protein
MLPAIPITLILIEWILCFTVGMHLFGDTAMRRLGELSACILLWIFGVRLLAVAFSFAAAKRLNTGSQFFAKRGASSSAFPFLSLFAGYSPLA